MTSLQMRMKLNLRLSHSRVFIHSDDFVPRNAQYKLSSTGPVDKRQHRSLIPKPSPFQTGFELRGGSNV